MSNTLNREQRRRMMKQFRGRGKRRQTHLDRNDIKQVFEMKRQEIDAKKVKRGQLDKAKDLP